MSFASTSNVLNTSHDTARAAADRLAPLDCLAIQINKIEDPDTRHLALETAMARDAAYDALQAYADAVYAELAYGTHHAKGMRFDAALADLTARGILSEIGTEMAHDWEYGPTAP